MFLPKTFPTFFDSTKDNERNEAKRNSELLEHECENHRNDLAALKIKCDTLENSKANDIKQIEAIQCNNETLKETSKRLNKEISEAKSKFKNELIQVTKDFKSQIKHWKNKLGKERKKKIKLEKDLATKVKSEPEVIKPVLMLNPTPVVSTSPSNHNSSSASTSTYSSSNLHTTTYNGSNLATTSVKTYGSCQDILTPPNRSECHHPKQCMSRQPKPPPPDKCKVLVHLGSRYHEQMASKDGVPSRYGTHEYCMWIDHESYGCEECV